MEPLRDPLEKEDESLPSYAGEEQHQQEVNTLYTKHVTDKIRKELEIPDATDDEAFSVLHGTQVPDSNPEEFKKIIDDVYGNDFIAPKMPFVAIGKPSQVGGVIADLPINMFRDIIGIPQGAYEIARGVGKMGKGQLEGVKQTAFSGTPPSAENSYTQEGKEDIEKGFQHVVRGGAFLAANALTGATAPALMKPGMGFLKTLGADAILGGIWLGAYKGIRESAKPEADIPHVTKETGIGTLEGAMFGAGTGLVHGGVKAYKLQKTRAAETLKYQHRAEFEAEHRAKQDALAKQAREQLKNSGEDLDALEKEVPIGQTSKPILNQASGTRHGKTGLFWQVTLDKGNGHSEVHTIVGETEKEAEKIAEIYAKHRNAKVVGRIDPQLERRQSDIKPLVGLRKGEVAEMSLEDIIKAIPQANPEQRIVLARELDRRPLGTSPYSKENPVDITKNSSWITYLSKLREKSKTDPKDIALKDELFRAEQNYEQFKKMKAAKVETSMRNGAEAEIQQVRKMSDARLLKKYGARFPGEEASNVRSYVLSELRSITKKAEPHVKELEIPEEIQPFVPASEMNVEELPTPKMMDMLNKPEVSSSKPLADALKKVKGKEEETLKLLAGREEEINQILKDAEDGKITTKEAHDKITDMLEAAAKKIRSEPKITKIPPAEIVGKKKPLPSRTLLIGRGMNGQVRVEFPDETHADLFSLPGRFQKLLRDPNIPASEKTENARRYKGSLVSLATQLKMTETEVYKLARQYRERITEFVKGHPTYEESGVTLKAPGLEEKIDEASLDPEQLRKLYEASLIGNKEEVNKILPNSYQLSKSLTKTEPFVKVFYEAPEITKDAFGKEIKIVSFNPDLRRTIPEHLELAKKFAKIPDYEILADRIEFTFMDIQDILTRFDKRYETARFGGFSTYNHFGMNVGWGNISQIYLNPWRISRVIEKMRDRSTPEELNDLWARLIYDYLMHEITHQVVRFESTAHELKGMKTEIGRAFNRELRKNMERMRATPIEELTKYKVKTDTSYMQRMIIQHDKLLNPEG